MLNSKPLYPPPWWAGCPDNPPAACSCFDIGDEFIVRFQGYDCEGSCLFAVERKKCQTPQRPSMPVYPPRPCFCK